MIVIYCLSSVIIIFLLVYIYNCVTLGLCKSSVHLVGKVAIVTGANSGIGFEVAKDLAQRGAYVILACRNEQRALEAIKKIKEISKNENVHYRHLDLGSLISVRNFASEILQSESRLDILINNAGTIRGANRKTVDGFSLLMQSNYIGPFLLTSLLIPLLQASAPSRIINVSSMVQGMMFSFDPSMIHEISERLYPLTNTYCYSRTKLCTNLMTVELARRLEGTGVTTNCLHPGVVKTDILNKLDVAVIKLGLKLFLAFFKSPWEGAQTVIYLAVSPELESCSGGYYVDCKLTNPSRRAQNQELAIKLWNVTEKLVR